MSLQVSEFSDLIEVERAGDATTIDSNGDFISVAQDSPRYARDFGGGAIKGVLIEGQRTNIQPNSAQPSSIATGWSATGSTVAPVAGTFKGLFSDAKAISSNGEIWHRMNGVSFTVQAGEYYCASFFVKPGTSGKYRLGIRNGNDATESAFQGAFPNAPLNNGTSIIFIDSGLDDIGGGYYRVWGAFQVKSGDSGKTFSTQIGPNSAVPGEDIILLGGQLEKGKSPTSFVVSGESAATRGQDRVRMRNLAPWYRSGFSVLAEFYKESPGEDFQRVLQFDAAGDQDNRLGVNCNSDGDLRFGLFSGGVTQASFDLASGIFPSDSATRHKVCVVVDAKNLLVRGAYNGSDAVESTILETGETYSELGVGAIANGAQAINGVISSIKFFPTPLSAAQMKAITS